MENTPDYITVVAHATEPHRFNVVLMSYVEREDNWRPKKCSNPMRLEDAAKVARDWQAVFKVDIRGNAVIEGADKELRDMEFPALINLPQVRELVNALVPVLTECDSVVQARALALCAGMLFGEQEGQDVMADSYGEFVTYADRKRLFLTVMDRGYEFVVNGRTQAGPDSDKKVN